MFRGQELVDVIVMEGWWWGGGCRAVGSGIGRSVLVVAEGKWTCWQKQW